MDRKILSALRSLSLAYFLATAGLMAGPKVIVAIRDHGVVLIAIGLGSAVISELAGFVVGRYFWKINWVLLSGAICGAMTSTPGLGAAIDATGSEDCASGYGATYPVAIVCMVLFTTLIYRGLALLQ
jgi:putative transport protein